MGSDLRAPFAALLAGALIAFAPGSARAGDDPTTRAAVRQLGVDGLKLYKDGRFADALDKFAAADNLMPAHTLGLGAARCLAKMGRLVEAAEKYLEVQRRPLEKNALDAQRAALRSAITERDELLPRIPQLVLHVRGDKLSEVEVKLDGKPFPKGLLDQKTPIDPGPHKLVLERGSATLQKVIQLDEGRTQEVTVTAPSASEKAPAPKGDDSALPIGGWIATSIGLAGVVTFGVSGVVAISQEGSLKAACPGGVCPPSEWGAVDAYGASKAATVAGLVIGSVGLAIGIPMLAVSAGRKPADAPKASLVVCPDGAGVRVAY